mgnify:FL=1
MLFMNIPFTIIIYAGVILAVVLVYFHFVDNKCIYTSKWYILDNNKLYLEQLTDMVNWENGEINYNHSRGTIAYLRYKGGLLEAGIEHLDYVHESLWDTLYNTRK